MDTINILQLDAATFKYAEGLIQVMRDCEDPFKMDAGNSVFNQSEARQIKALDLFAQKSSSA